MKRSAILVLVCGFGFSSLAFADLKSDLETVKQIGHRGENVASAQSALNSIQAQGESALVPILEAMDDANPLARNFLRNAFEVIADRAYQVEVKLPLSDLLVFLKDKSHNSAARRLAFEWIRKQDAETAGELIPTFLDDPSDELRREAVAQLLEESGKADEEQRRVLLEKALTGATDDDQVRKIVKGLEAFDVEIDLQEHYGFLGQWKMIGPFDNKDEKGFNVAYPPESELKYDAEYEGQLGPVTWQSYETDDNYGVLDIAKQIAPHKGAVIYAIAEFVSEKPQPIEFRLSTPNAWKIWLNGELIFEREEYHRGTFFDQYRIPAELKSGTNVILLKILQNEQEQSWAQDWKFQFRVCQPTGMALKNAK